MTKVYMKIRVDKNLLKQADKIYKEYGLDDKTVIKAYFKKIINIGGIPFTIDVKDKKEISSVVKEKTILNANIKPNYINIPIEDK